MAIKEYIVGRGSAFAAKRTNGVPGQHLPLSNLKSFSFSLAVEQGEHNESQTIQSMLDATWTTKKSGKVDAEFEDVNRNNAKILFAARVAEVAASTATGIVIASVLPEVGGIVTLPRGNASSVVIKDSTSGTAKTLTAGVNYAPRDNWVFGSADVLDMTSGGPFVAPLKADYSYGAQSRATLLTADDEEYELRFEGISMATGQRALYEFWRVKFPPADKLDLIGNEVAAPKCSISLLADTSKLIDGEFGQFGRITYLGKPA